MARNSSGVYQLPVGTPVVPNTVIQSVAFNALAQDIANEITASLPRDGRAGMTAGLRLASGALSVGGLGFTEAPTTGLWYDPSRSALVLSVAGTEVAVFTAAGIAATGLVAPGTILPFAGATAPLGTLLCFGQAVSRSTYSRLFAAIGTAFGTGDGSTTFGIPDLRGSVPVGLDNAGGVDALRMQSQGTARTTLGGRGGADGVTLTNAQLPATLPNGSVTVSYPAHGYNTAGGTTSIQSGGGALFPNILQGLAGANTFPPGNQTFGVTNSNPGGGQPAAVVQPSVFTNYIIQA